MLTEPDVRRLMVHAEDARFGDRLTTRMVLEHWRRGFNLSQPSNFNSFFLFLETRLDAGLREAAGWEQVHSTISRPKGRLGVFCITSTLAPPSSDHSRGLVVSYHAYSTFFWCGGVSSR